jgi:glycosyltransferase involved in cell wall biosynthesis
MRILWHSNAPWAKTGYGNQTALFWHRLQALGYPVTLSSNYGLQGAPLDIQEGEQKSRVLPTGYTTHGNDIIASHAKYAKADIVITLYDAWVFDPNVTARFRWCPWMPIDHDPAPPPVLNAIRTAYQPIAYSQFGFEKLKEAGLDPRYVPHGIDTTVMRPMKREDAVAKLSFPEQVQGYDFLAVMVAANKGTPSRKSFAQVLWAWKKFLEDHPNALLYMHTVAGPQMNGMDLEEQLEALNIPTKNVLFADPYWSVMGYPDSYMATIYSAADVLVSPSMGEGFGLPIVEAQACGCPVIVGNWTSMPELTFEGWKVEGEPFFTPQGSWQFIPYVDDIEHALEAAYDAKDDQGMRTRARQGALAYDVDTVTRRYWKPVLEELDAEIKASETGGGLDMVTLA